ncbi:Hypothetical protein CINCED_3A025820 [Cinara cedri]|uniref:Uncharacterized protein n=1 Tax=Cinara cedri TaxID=506608 RepID=A0A5E4NJA0_9HEMI|nr:Hypothetical protein CINCED_3A019679 [Cinara cedri]VVC42388.1 Hypothetical protein CINCED_3A006438 [Cinara cedri]VVC43733.1 Hypothetical protein CINCED_3A021276 [Cinara cedri]VVC43761.1 Hypothetical protein CINCED_3A025820 [Cinara cedri]
MEDTEQTACWCRTDKRKYEKMGIWRARHNLHMWTRADNVTPTCLPKRAKPMYTRGPYDKQQEGGKYSHILDKRKDIISMQYLLPLY